MHLRQAKIEKFGHGNCGFCTYNKLASVIQVKNASEPDKPQIIETKPDAISESVDSSLTSENTQKQLTMSQKTENKDLDSSIAEAKEKIKEAEEEKKKQSNSDYKGFDLVEAKLARFEVENRLLKEKLEEITGKYDTLNAKYKSLERENQKAQIASVVNASLYPDKTQREKMIDYFVDNNIPANMVEEMYASIGTIPNVKSASYDSKVPAIKTAKTANFDEGSSLAREVRNMFIKGGKSE